MRLRTPTRRDSSPRGSGTGARMCVDHASQHGIGLAQELPRLPIGERRARARSRSNAHTVPPVWLELDGQGNLGRGADRVSAGLAVRSHPADWSGDCARRVGRRRSATLRWRQSPRHDLTHGRAPRRRRGPRARGTRYAVDPRVRRLRVPLLAPSLPVDRARRAGALGPRPLRVPPLPADPDPSARARRPAAPKRQHGKVGSGRCTSSSSIARRRSRTTICASYAGELGLDLARFDRTARATRCSARIASRRRERRSHRVSSRHADAVHRRRPAPGRLRHGDAAARRWHGDAAGAAPRRLAADQGHTAPLLPGRRQGPAGDDAAAQPLVERSALRRRARPHDAPAPPPRHDVPDRPRLRRPRRSSSAPPTAAAVPSSSPTASGRRLRPAAPPGARRARSRRRDQGAAVRRADDDAVPGGPRARSWDRDDVERFGRILDWTDRCSRSSAAGSAARRAPSISSGTASTSPSPASPVAPRRRSTADASPGRRTRRELISFGFWAGDDNLGDAAYYSYTAPSRTGYATNRCPVGEWTDTGTGSLAILPYDAVRTAADPRDDAARLPQSAYEAGARTAGWDTLNFESNWCPTPEPAAGASGDRSARVRPAELVT